MQSLVSSLENAGGVALSGSVSSIIGSMLLAFVLGQVIAWVYSFSHTGMSYSRAFTQSLLMMTVIVSLVLYVIGNSIVTAFGLLGALALIRFRNVLKDTKDTVFVFMSLVVGMAVGSQRFSAAITGTGMMVAIILYLNWTSFGNLAKYDGYLTCRVDVNDANELSSEVSRMIRRFCREVRVVSTRQAADDAGAEMVYQVGLRDRSRCNELLEELGKLTPVRHASFVMRAELSEG